MHFLIKILRRRRTAVWLSDELFPSGLSAGVSGSGLGQLARIDDGMSECSGKGG